MTLQEYNDLFKNTLVKKMSITSSGGVTITNTNICSEQMSLEESLCSDTNLVFGACESSCFKLRIADISHNFEGEWLDVHMNVYTDEEGYLLAENGDYLLTESGEKIKLKDAGDSANIHMGQYKVHSDKPSNDRRWRDLTCYDAMYDILNADVATWYSGLTFPMTIKNFRDSFFTEVGITQETVTLCNDSFQIQGGFVTEGELSGKTVINAICEFNGVFGHINASKKFEYISLGSTPALTLDWYVDGTGTYEDYTTAVITGIIARSNGSDVGTTVGTTTNPYIMQDNPLIYGTEGTQALTTALTNLLTQIGSITYRPFSVTTYGNPMLPLGTQITVDTRDQTVVSYVITKLMSGIQALKDTISAEGDKKLPSVVNSVQSQIKRTKGIVHEVINEVDQMSSTIYDSTNGLVTQVSQTKNQIVMKVDSNGNIVKVKLSVDPDDSSATIFSVSAANISFIANNAIKLTTNNLSIDSTHFSVSSSGAITSTSGTIAGWTISNNLFYKEVTSGSAKYRPFMNAPSSPDINQTRAFGVRKELNGDYTYPFYVTYGGRIVALDGNIAGWEFDDTQFYRTVTTSESNVDVTYKPFLNAPANPTTGNIAFGVSRYDGTDRTYPFRVNYDGSLTATNATIKGAINTTSLKIDNKANMSIETRTVTESDFTITSTSVVVSSTAVVADVLRISSGYGLYIPSVVEFGDYASFQDVSANKISCSNQYISGNLYVAGWIHTDDLEIKSATPVIDFHMGLNDNTDYTYRLIHRATDTLDFVGHTGSTWGILKAAQFAVQSSKYAKKNIKTITDDEAKKILELNPVSFDYKQGANDQRGLIAEEVLDVLPNMVTIPEGYTEYNPEESWNTPSIDYSKFVPYLIKMVQIQQREIEALKK